MGPATHSQFGLAGGPPGRSGASCAMGPAAVGGIPPPGVISAMLTKNGGLAHAIRTHRCAGIPVLMDQSRSLSLCAGSIMSSSPPRLARRRTTPSGASRRERPPSRRVLQKRAPADAVAVRPITLEAPVAPPGRRERTSRTGFGAASSVAVRPICDLAQNGRFAIFR